MTKSTKQSSRKRMNNRINRYIKSSMGIYYRLDPKSQESILCSNRPKRRAEAAIKRRYAKRHNTYTQRGAVENASES